MGGSIHHQGEVGSEQGLLCGPPKDVRVPLHLLVVAALDAPTPELAKRYVQKIAEIVEWVWPTNTRQRFDVYQLGDVMVEIPTKKGS